jgi:hypothetical protein
MSNVAELVGLLGKGKGAKFAAVTYRAKRNNELARFLLILNASTEELYRKDIAALNEILPTLSPVEKLVAQEIIDSRIESLALGVGNNSRYTCADVYVMIDGIHNIKVHKETGVIYVNGLCEQKTVLEKGDELPPVNSAEKTIIKRKLQHEHCASVRFRQFIIKRIHKLSANGEVIEIEGE